MATAVLRPRSSSEPGRRAAGEETSARQTSVLRPAPVQPLAGELRPAEEFLQTLARAVRQFHTYPATSPHCVEAVEESRRVLNLIAPESLVCVVSPRELLIDGRAIGRDTPVEHELARRLYESRCETIAIDRSATPREIARLCIELAARRDRHRDTPSLDERLRNHCVERINVSSSYEPVLFDVDATAQTCAVVEQERRQQEFDTSGGRVAHLYPADKGWVRMDPAIELNQVTLTGLARLVEDPASLAGMLAKLAADTADLPSSPADALEQRCEDVARLYSSLDPAVARARFARLASAVLSLESSRRRRLLTKKVLPGLVDGRPEGNVLRDFPDVELADALSLLLDVETAAPELLNSALDRLHLSPDRQIAVAPLLEERIRAHGRGTAGLRQDAALEERTQQLIQIANGTASFHDFAAVDLGTDDATEGVIAGTNDAIHATNLADAQLTCVSQLLALPVHADRVDGLVRQAIRLLGELDRTQSLAEMASQFEMLQRTASAARDSRPTVSESITAAIEAFYTPVRFDRLVTLYQGSDEERALAKRILAALGSSLTPAVVRAFDGRSGDTAMSQLVSDHAAVFAPAIAKLIDQFPVPQRIAAIRLLSAAGRGAESHVARQLTHQNDGVVREALAALARIGSESAAEFVTRHLQRVGQADASGTEQLLWQFAPAVTRQCLRTLLRQRQFVAENPALILSLLQRVDRLEGARLGDVLKPLTSFRFRFWNGSLMRVGRQAAVLVRQ
jgi:hypothetical protein